ncbi:hypothetical protein Acr_15g0002620 [Actinidia rufa]|uniref:Uncharacterized protein n=1 Tax=Actinidia rufa TaxID=165716 RepID=A0A7J0FSJ4_9ERIC|nr:hypothetical protein Acr_15g0002620 [Actinidia rufa]
MCTITIADYLPYHPNPCDPSLALASTSCTRRRSVPSPGSLQPLCSFFFCFTLGCGCACCDAYAYRILCFNVLLIVACCSNAVISWAFAAMDTKSATVSIVSCITIPASNSKGLIFCLLRLLDSTGITLPHGPNSLRCTRGQEKYVTDAPPYREAPTFAAWKAEAAQIHIRLWNSMEPQISSSLVYLDTAKQILGAKELPSLGELFSRFCQASLPHVVLFLLSVLAWLHYWDLIVLQGVGLDVVGVIPPGMAVFLDVDVVILVVVAEVGVLGDAYVSKDSMVTISAEEYQRLLMAELSATATLVQTSVSVACVATHIPWVLDL